jgi:hypothetical protein
MTVNKMTKFYKPLGKYKIGGHAWRKEMPGTVCKKRTNRVIMLTRIKAYGVNSGVNRHCVYTGSAYHVDQATKEALHPDSTHSSSVLHTLFFPSRSVYIGGTGLISEAMASRPSKKNKH